MINPRPVNKFDALDGVTSGLTFRTFRRAAVVANLLVATLVFVEFSRMPLVEHDPGPFKIGLECGSTPPRGSGCLSGGCHPAEGIRGRREPGTSRHFSGRTLHEAAEDPGIAPRTADAGQAHSRAWLAADLSSG